MIRLIAAACAMALAGCATQAPATELSFSAVLSGRQDPTNTGSVATGTAAIRVNIEAQTVDVMLNVEGISRDALWDHVIHSGVGPVHLHRYAANGDISLLVPFPYGAAYADAPNGFSLTIEDMPYAENAALVGSALSFDQFVATLGADFVYLNIHTDAFQDGEISGRLISAG
jgi:hypothetical protein